MSDINSDHLGFVFTPEQTVKTDEELIKVKGKASSLDIAPLAVLKSGTLQPRKWQLTGND